jgi:integrase
VEKLVAGAKKRRFIDLHDAIVLSLNTGLRLGELRRLHWPDVDLTHGVLTVREEDMRKPGGKVPLNKAASAIFSERLQRRGENQLVFPPIYGQGHRENLSHEFRSLADEVGLNAGIADNDRQRRIVFHSLRHTFASWLALAGTDIYRIKTLMRHKSITMTMRYAHLIPDATQEAVHNLKPPPKKPSR